jgi:hypothetical protein
MNFTPRVSGVAMRFTGCRRTFWFTSLVAGALLYVSTGTAAAKPARASLRITASYAINFDGMNIGSFTMRAKLVGNQYRLKATMNISLLAGIIFEWKGSTLSSGRVVNNKPTPKNYSFGYRTSNKSEKIRVKFAGNAVREVAVSPPQRPSSRRVPITRQHMRNVVDPLSAVLLITHSDRAKSGRGVCNRILPIFDGKQRYDLRFSYKRTKIVSVGNHRRSAYICRVKFIPISGHKLGSRENQYATQTNGMEVWMIPVAQPGTYVPYYIRVPTPVGVVTMTSRRVNVAGTNSAEKHAGVK